MFTFVVVKLLQHILYALLMWLQQKVCMFAKWFH
jgi:hypothetical protein